MFTQYKFSPVQISDAAVAAAKALAAARPDEQPVQFAAQTIADRLIRKPENYLQYGPYWWAVKAALRALGHDFGAAGDEAIRAEYGGEQPAYGAMVAGEQFRAHYGAMFLAGTAQFWLDEEAEESYVLFDRDMEVRRLGGARPLLVALDGQSVEVADGAPVPVLDSAPFGVQFEHEAELWQANVYAASADAASARVRDMLASTRLLRAIDASKTGALLDSVDGDALLIDRKARRVCEVAARPAS